MRPFTDLEAFPKAEFQLVCKHLGGIEAMILELALTDLSRGKAKLPGVGRCFWLADARRVEIEIVHGGGWIASTSKEPDPDAPPAGSFPKG